MGIIINPTISTNGKLGAKYSSDVGTVSMTIAKSEEEAQSSLALGAYDPTSNGVGNLVTSVDDGATWSSFSPKTRWGINFRQLYAASKCRRNNQYIYFIIYRPGSNTYYVYSKDSGVTWNISSSMVNDGDNIGSGDMSYDGEYAMYGTYQDGIYYTCDGMSTVSYDDGDSQTHVCMSKFAEYMYYTSWNNTGKVYYSTNQGSTWLNYSFSASRGRPIYCSDDGQYLINGSTTSISGCRGASFSDDFGANWTTLTALTVETHVNMSFSGQYMYYATHDGVFHVSSDYGQSWSTYSAPGHNTGDPLRVYPNRTTGKAIIQSYTGNGTFFYWEPGQTSIWALGTIIPTGHAVRGIVLTITNTLVVPERVNTSTPGKIWRSDGPIVFGVTPTFSSVYDLQSANTASWSFY